VGFVVVGVICRHLHALTVLEQYKNNAKARRIAIPSLGDGKLIGVGLFFKNETPFTSNERFFAFPAWLYVDRITGGHCHYRNSCGHVVASLEQGKAEGPGNRVYEQYEATDAGLDYVCR
jgi:hypothetical protein